MQFKEGTNSIADVLTKRYMNIFEKSSWMCAIEYLYSEIRDEANRVKKDLELEAREEMDSRNYSSALRATNFVNSSQLAEVAIRLTVDLFLMYFFVFHVALIMLTKRPCTRDAIVLLQKSSSVTHDSCFRMCCRHMKFLAQFGKR